MKTLRAMLVRFAGLFRKKQHEAEMNEELLGHIEALSERNVAAGMSPSDARDAALRAFGGVAQIAERARDERRSVWVEQVLQDVRYAARSLAKARSFTITAVLTLALGIGVNAALFTVYNLVALRPLPVKDPESLVRIAGQNRRGAAYPNFSYAEYLAYREGTHTLDGLLAVNEASAAFQQESGAARDPIFEGRGAGTVPVEWVSDNYFSVLGGAMQLGRTFLPDETRVPGGAPVIVLSHLFWERHFRRDPNIVGTTVALGRDRQAFTVIGVAAEEFLGQHAAPPAGWLPLGLWSNSPAAFTPNGLQAFRLVGRLKPGVTAAQVKADLDAIAARRAVEFPREDVKTSVRLERGLRFVTIPLNAKSIAALGPVFLGFGMVLVIACTNVANLLLARGVSRQTEIGVRLTLGASRGRIVRQLLTENLLLCVLGAVVGLAFALWTLQFLQPLILGQLPAEWAAESRRWHFLKVAPDLRIVGYTALLTVGATLFAGLLPAWHAAAASLIATVRNEGTAFGRRLSPSRLRQVLVIAQVAVCLMLLSCAGLLARNLFALQKVDLGFDPHAVFAATVTRNAVLDEGNVAFRQAMESLRTIPGVAASAVVVGAPLLNGSGLSVRIRAADGATGAPEEDVRRASITGGYFDTFGISLRRGRSFRELEQHAAARAIIVSESLARRLWPGQEAVGKVLAVSEEAWASRQRPAPPDAFRECEVIGVAGDVAMRVREQDNARVIYLPFALEIPAQSPVFVRPRSDSPAALAEIVRAAGAAGVGLTFYRRVSAWHDEELLPFRGLAILSGALGALALAMAAVGLYGVMSFSVNQRVREIGIRVALGATAEKVVALFVRQGMRLVMIGLALGLVGGGLFALLLAKILYGLGGAFDPMAFGAVTVIFAVIALFACWLPARRATKVDPVVALRAE